VREERTTTINSDGDDDDHDTRVPREHGALSHYIRIYVDMREGAATAYNNIMQRAPVLYIRSSRRSRPKSVRKTFRCQNVRQIL